MPIGTPVMAVGDGVIVDCQDGVQNQPVGRAAGSGAPSNWVILKFTFPAGPYKGQTGYAYYQHLTKGGVLVTPGQKVKQGQVICKSGNSGNTTGPHLHITVLKPGFTMNRATRYAYLSNPSMVVWEPVKAWGGTTYGSTPVYVSKLQLGVDDSKSVRRLRQALIVRGLLKPAAGLNRTKPGNKYTPAVKNAVALWQKRHGHEQTGILTLTQTKEFFKRNKKVQVLA